MLGLCEWYDDTVCPLETGVVCGGSCRRGSDCGEYLGGAAGLGEAGNPGMGPHARGAEDLGEHLA